MFERFDWLRKSIAWKDSSVNHLAEPTSCIEGDCSYWTKQRDEDPIMQSYMDKVLTLKRGLLRSSFGQIGALFDGDIFLCHICEDPSRDVKEYGITAIPAGVYQIEMNTEQGRATKHGGRWPWHKKEIFHLLNVEGFEYIQIHPGNTPHDTLGCLLPGKWNGRSMSVSQSAIEYKKLYEKYAAVARLGYLSIRIEE